jgi:transcriptional regulator with XRE-family HTH domain
MKQPALGLKIAELRRVKGWTQEELVDMCNISVRTIQRIEAGEVMPRSYTIRTIFSALNHDPGEVFKDDADYSLEQDDNALAPESNEFAPELQDGESITKPSDIKLLHLAWLFGIVYILLSIIEVAVEIGRFSGDGSLLGTPVYISLKLAVLAAFVLFQAGFIIIGKQSKNTLLHIMSFVLIGIHVLAVGSDIASVLIESFGRELILIGVSVLIGLSSILFGFALRKLEPQFGRVALFAALLEILAGFLFLTVIFSPLGDLVHVPAELLKIVIIFRAVGLFKNKAATAVAV